MPHVVSSCSTFLPSFLKVFQRVFDLQCGQKINAYSLSNITKRDNAKSKKGKVTCNILVTRRLVLLTFLLSMVKIFQRVFELQTQNLFQTKQREITPKVRKPELLFLYMTYCLFLFYISTNYHQNIPKGIQVTEERTRRVGGWVVGGGGGVGGGG